MKNTCKQNLLISLHLSATLYFLDKCVTELVWTVLPHYRTLEATIFEAILMGRSFNFFT